MLLANMLSYSQALLFDGGNGDGAVSFCYEQTDNLVDMLFLGGIGDGAVSSCYQQTQDLEAIGFLGGIGDGQAAGCFDEDIVIPVFGLFTGGNGDGFNYFCHAQLGELENDLFMGGNEDGFDLFCHTQLGESGNDLFMGGNEDGFDLFCFSMDDPLIGLPIELIGFEAMVLPKERIVKLSWKTLSESNNDYFVIERAINGIDWEFVSKVDGSGNSSTSIEYLAHDFTPYSGLSYYRLKQVDFDGEFTYSYIRSVILNSDHAISNQLLVYPNPVTSLINFQFDKFNNDEVTILIYDMNGRELLEEPVQLDNGQGLYTLGDFSIFAAGSYLVIISVGNRVELRQKFIVI